MHPVSSFARSGATAAPRFGRRDLPALLAIAWSALYLIGGIVWRLDPRSYPWGRRWDAAPIAVSVLDDVPATAGAAVVAGVGALGLAAGGVLLLGRRAGWAGRAATGFALAVTLAVITVGDYRPLMAVARTPVFLITKTFLHIPAGVSYGLFFREMWTLPVLNDLVLYGGIVCWLIALARYWARVRGGCPRCGRTARPRRWTTRDGARRWGRVAVVIACLGSVPYVLARYLLLAGVPVDGFSRAEIVAMAAEQPGIWVFGAGLATFGLVGSVLTLGLAQRWGERWPFWMPGLRGRTIPVLVPVVPAVVVALLLPGTGLMLMRITIAQHGGLVRPGALLTPPALWPVWGVALAAAALAYWLRRRPTCATCGRG